MKRKASRDWKAWIAARDKKLGDDPICETCGEDRPDYLTCHHLHNHGTGYRDHRQSNLVITCDRCHRSEHNPRDKDFWKGENE